MKRQKDGTIDLSDSLEKVWGARKDGVADGSPLAFIPCAYDADPRTGTAGLIRGYRPVYSEKEYDAVLSEALKGFPETMREAVLRVAEMTRKLLEEAQLDMEGLVPVIRLTDFENRKPIYINLADIKGLHEVDWAKVADSHLERDVLEKAEAEKLFRQQSSRDLEDRIKEAKRVEHPDVSAEKEQKVEEKMTIDAADGVHSNDDAKQIYEAATAVGISTTGHVGIKTVVSETKKTTDPKQNRPPKRTISSPKRPSNKKTKYKMGRG